MSNETNINVIEVLNARIAKANAINSLDLVPTVKARNAVAALIQASLDRRDAETAVAWGQLSAERVTELCQRYGTTASWTRPAHETHAAWLAALNDVGGAA